MRTVTAFMNSVALGMTTRWPSVWRMWVSRMVISSTNPSISWHSMKSPSRNGSRSRMSMPAMKFSKMSLKAKPTAMDPRPSAVRALAGVTVGKMMTAAVSRPTIQIRMVASWRNSSPSDLRSRVRAKTFLRPRSTPTAASQVTPRKIRPMASCGRSERKSPARSRRLLNTMRLGSIKAFPGSSSAGGQGRPPGVLPRPRVEQIGGRAPRVGRARHADR